MQHPGNMLLKAIRHPGRAVGHVSERLVERCYAFLDSRFHVEHDKPVLFVDCGSNVGQGFGWFSSFYSGDNVDFHLFEPNPNCIPYLEKLRQTSGKGVRVFNQGVGTVDGTFRFYGLGEDEGGALSQGGSINPAHNSLLYTPSEERAIDVTVIDFARYLREESRKYDQIVVKMDIEGAEVELLEALIASGAIDAISILYVEFHSHYQFEPERSRTKAREEAIVRALRDGPTRVRIWH